MKIAQFMVSTFHFQNIVIVFIRSYFWKAVLAINNPNTQIGTFKLHSEETLKNSP